jgi:type IV pilus assembly protein PilC
LTRAAEGDISEKILKEIVETIEGGETFSAALRRYEIIFGSDAIQSVEIGEASGRLQEVTTRLAGQLERSYATNRKVQSAMYYPLVVLIAAFVAAVVMINITLPVFESFYGAAGNELPLITAIFLGIGRFLSAHLFLISVIILAAVVFFLIIYREVGAFKYFCDTLKLKVKILREIELRNLFSRLSFLLESGITLDDAIKLSASSSGNLKMQRLLEKIKSSVEAGEKFGTTLKRVLENLSPLYLGLLVTGEASGNIVEMLRQCEAMADFEIEETLKALPAKAEVYGTLTAGLIVGALVFSIVLPILNMTDLL